MTTSNKDLEVESFKNFLTHKINKPQSLRGKRLKKMMILSQMASELGIDSYRISIEKLTTEEIIKLRKVIR